MPWLNWFWAEAALPVSVTGPEECWALARLAWIWASVAGMLWFPLEIEMARGEGFTVTACEKWYLSVLAPFFI
jgi:hypothetical protein